MRTFFRRCALAALSLLILFLLCAATLCISGLREAVFPADAAVVLGNTAYPDGTPSPRLAARLERAVDLYRDGLCPVIIVSGAVGKEGVDEAVVMAAYLKLRGIPPEAVVVDSSGRNTAATARFTAKWAQEHNARRIIAVSQYFHLPRTRMALLRAGLPEVGTASARYWEWRDVFSVPREVAAFVVYFLR